MGGRRSLCVHGKEEKLSSRKIVQSILGRAMITHILGHAWIEHTFHTSTSVLNKFVSEVLPCTEQDLVLCRSSICLARVCKNY